MILNLQNAQNLIKEKSYNFENINKLEIEGLEVLFDIQGVLLKFPNVKTIDCDVLIYFLRYKGNNAILLDGLDAIDDEQAEILGKIPQSLSLNGLTTLSKKAAFFLINRVKGTDNTLYLNGLTDLSDEIFDIITKSKTPISLDGLLELNESKAKSLVKNHKDYVSLNGIKKISNKISEILSNFKGFLYLNGLEQINEFVSANLIKFNGRTLSLSKEVRHWFNKSIFIATNSSNEIQICILKYNTNKEWIYLYVVGYAGGGILVEKFYKFKREISRYSIFQSDSIPDISWDFFMENESVLEENDLTLSNNDKSIVSEMLAYMKGEWLNYGDTIELKEDNLKLIKKNTFTSPYWDDGGTRILQLISKEWDISYKW